MPNARRDDDYKLRRDLDTAIVNRKELLDLTKYRLGITHFDYEFEATND